MPIHPARLLYHQAELPEVLQLPEEEVGWLIKTGQLRSILIAGEVRFTSRELDALIATYEQIAKRKNYVQ